MSLMNSSFFHYLQFGQTFDYVGSNQFMMVPTYVGIDPNLDGLYSLVNEGMTRSLASFSSYPSLYNVFYKYKGKPSVDIGTKTVDFSQDPATSTQYQYLDGSGKKVNVTRSGSGSEFALDESVIRLILLSIGYFLPNHQWDIDAYGINMEKVTSTPTAGYLLSSYGVIGFSPSEPDVINRYKLYVFNKDNSFGIPAGQFVVKNMLVKYISYCGKALITDPIWANKLEVIGSVDNFSEHAKKIIVNPKSYEYSGSKYANTAESFNKINTLFLLPGNKGFGYLTYDNQLKMCFLNSKNLHDQLKSDHFKSLLSNKNELSIFYFVVPVGKMLFTSTLSNDNIILNGHFYINNSVVDNNTTMWIIIGICSAAAVLTALGLGLAIGIQMRKNVKIQLAVAKLSNKKIDMLSTTVAKSFRKLTEDTNTLLKNKPKALNSTVFNKAVWASPMVLKFLPKPQNKPTKEIKIVSIKPTSLQQEKLKHHHLFRQNQPNI